MIVLITGHLNPKEIPRFSGKNIQLSNLEGQLDMEVENSVL